MRENGNNNDGEEGEREREADQPEGIMDGPAVQEVCIPFIAFNSFCKLLPVGLSYFDIIHTYSWIYIIQVRTGLQVFVSTCYLFITTFFTSLVPENPRHVDVN